MLTIHITRDGQSWFGFKTYAIVTTRVTSGGHLHMKGLTLRALKQELGHTIRACLVANVPYEVTGEFVKLDDRVGKLK